MKKPLKLVAVPQRISYAVKIRMAVFRKLALGHTDKQSEAFDTLNKVPGICQLDYDGHFGNYVYFTADSDVERDEFMKVLTEVLESL